LLLLLLLGLGVGQLGLLLWWRLCVAGVVGRRPATAVAPCPLMGGRRLHHLLLLLH
jgi:hypothetical protein